MQFTSLCSLHGQPQVPVLPVQDAPLLRQLLLSGSPDQAPERLWLLRLLSAGMRGPEDGDIFRCLPLLTTSTMFRSQTTMQTKRFYLRVFCTEP